MVHRSFPGVPTPFIACVVELDGGGAIKGTLRGVAPDPEAVPFGMPVRVVFTDTDGADGSTLVIYHFVPNEGEAAA